MQIQVPVLGKFEFGKPQLYAALMLLVLAVQAAVVAYIKPVMPTAGWEDPREIGKVLWRARTGPGPNSAFLPQTPSDEILMYRLVEPILPGDPFPFRASKWQWRLFPLRLRAPFIVFSLWLGGALWWVSRRLYNNPGGYVALGLYCSSPAILIASTRVNPEILAAWGLFGAIYTAIGVAHTLYAPPKKWRIRIVLLGVALGFTAAAHLAAGVVALALGAFFILYLAPGRRLATVAILLISAVIAAALVWALCGSAINFLRLEPGVILRPQPSPTDGRALLVANLPALVATLAAVIIFLAWKRTRYFGNWSALLVFIVLAALVPVWGPAVLIWALPFAFVFVGGIWADLLERGYGHVVIVFLITLQEALSICVIAYSPSYR